MIQTCHFISFFTISCIRRAPGAPHGSKEPYLGGAFFQFPKICPTWLNTGPTWPHRAQPTSEKHLQIFAVWAVPTREVGWMFIYLESHNPSFFLVKRPWPFCLVITALIVWNYLCESCYGFSLPFFNKMSKKYGFATSRLVWELLVLRFFFRLFFSKTLKKYGFATGRTANDCNVLLIWQFFWSWRVTTIFYQKKVHYGFFPSWPDFFVFLAFQVNICHGRVAYARAGVSNASMQGMFV